MSQKPKKWSVDVDAIVTDLRARGIEEEMRDIARKRGVMLEEVLSKARIVCSEHIAHARGDMYWHLRTKYKWSYPYIGTVFHRDHANVMVTLKRRRMRAK